MEKHEADMWNWLIFAALFLCVFSGLKTCEMAKDKMHHKVLMKKIEMGIIK